MLPHPPNRCAMHIVQGVWLSSRLHISNLAISKPSERGLIAWVDWHTRQTSQVPMRAPPWRYLYIDTMIRQCAHKAGSRYYVQIRVLLGLARTSCACSRWCYASIICRRLYTSLPFASTHTRGSWFAVPCGRGQRSHISASANEPDWGSTRRRERISTRGQTGCRDTSTTP